MKKTVYIVLAITLLAIVIHSCSNNEQKPVGTEQDTTSQTANAIKDPNQPKPMALMMRQMAANADSMKAKLLRGEKLDSLAFPFIRFYLVQATDESVKEPQFYENARIYQKAHKAIFDNPNEQIKQYNLMIQACIGCHENYCSGPLRRIKKMPITAQ